MGMPAESISENIKRKLINVTVDLYQLYRQFEHNEDVNPIRGGIRYYPPTFMGILQFRLDEAEERPPRNMPRINLHRWPF